MKLITIFSLCTVALLTSCKTTKPFDPATVPPGFTQRGFIPYTTPRGNPNDPALWNEQGPGAIRNPAAGSVTATATRIIGADLVTSLAKREHPVAITAFDHTEITERHLNLLGSGPQSVVRSLKATLKLSADIEASVVMGQVSEIALSELEMLDACKKNHAAATLTDKMRRDLRDGRRHLVLGAIYADSMTYKFSRKQTTGGSLAITLPQTADLNIDGNNYHWTQAGYVMTEPRFLGYRLLGRDEVREVF